jgi:chemotaxis protein methyltransferase CheR
MNRGLTGLIEISKQNHSRDISIFDEDFLQKTLDKRAAAYAVSPAGYLAFLAGNPAEMEAFSQSLIISFSEFFRNPLTFSFLEQVVLPYLLEKKEKNGQREIRIWSAGCAAGMEAYSIAILLDELTATHEGVSYRIFATDLSEPALDSARRGEYEAAALQNVRLKHLGKYFSRQEEYYRIDPRLCEHIDFSRFDLLDEQCTCPPASIFGNFDLVFCSNLLFYYREDIRQTILSKIQRCLSPDGYLVTGEAERAIVEKMADFQAVAPLVSIYKNFW